MGMMSFRIAEEEAKNQVKDSVVVTDGKSDSPELSRKKLLKKSNDKVTEPVSNARSGS